MKSVRTFQQVEIILNFFEVVRQTVSKVVRQIELKVKNYENFNKIIERVKMSVKQVEV